MKPKDKIDYKKLNNMQDTDIDYSDIPATDAHFWSTGKVTDPGHKK